MAQDKRVEAYIAKAAPFAQPILERVRDVVHSACPNCEETLKWSTPTFTYKGKLLVGMAAFKEHCRLILWFGPQITGENFAERIDKVTDLPSKKELTRLIKESMKLIDSGARVMRRAPAKPKPRAQVPDDFRAALKKNKQALKHFEAFSPSCKREYIEWITEAKRAETRSRRIATAVQWIAQGKQRNWQYA